VPVAPGGYWHRWELQPDSTIRGVEYQQMHRFAVMRVASDDLRRDCEQRYRQAIIALSDQTMATEDWKDAAVIRGQENDNLRKDNDQKMTALADANNTIARLRPFATIGKITVAVVTVGVATVVYIVVKRGG